MRFLTVVMTVLLFFTITWMFILAFGPWIVSSYVERSTGSKLTLHNVEISPLLKLTSGHVRIDGLHGVSGDLRAVAVDWKMKAGQPVIAIEIGHLALLDGFTSEGVAITFDDFLSQQFARWNAEVKKVEYATFGSAREVKISGIIDTAVGKVSDVKGSLVSANIAQVGSWDLPIVEFGIDEIKLGTNLSRQSYTVHFLSPSAHSERLMAEMKDIYIGISGALEVIKYDFEISSVTNTGYDLAVSRFKGGGDVNVELTELASPIYVTVDRVQSKDFALSDIVIEANSDEQNLQFEVTGNAEETEISSGAISIALLPEFSFDVKASAFPYGDLQKLTLDATAQASQPPLTFELDKGSIIFNGLADQNCASMVCKVSEFSTDFYVEVDGARAQGAVSCATSPCSMNNIKSNIVTEDTDDFFERLQLTKIINSGVLGVAYLQFRRGMTVGRGHLIEF